MGHRGLAGQTGTLRSIANRKALHQLIHIRAIMAIKSHAWTNEKHFSLHCIHKKTQPRLGFSRWVEINLELITQFYTNCPWPVHGTCCKKCCDREKYLVTIVRKVLTITNQRPFLSVVPNRDRNIIARCDL